VQLRIPSNLAADVRCDLSPDRSAWLRRLTCNVAACARRWALRLGEPYEPGGQCSWVAPAQDSRGRRLVLKVTWRHPEAEHEADALRAWDGRGSVLLHDAEPALDETTAALLLERCPGPMLSTRPEPEQDSVIAGLLSRLWSTQVDGSAYRPLAEMCAAWNAVFEQRLAQDPARLDPGLARAGTELFVELSSAGAQDVLLVTDLHAGNVLGAHREPWLIIDPKPYVGDRAYDVVQHMFNCEERLVADPVGLARRMAALADLDSERVTRWLFARCVHGSLDEPDLLAIALALTPG
jgi:streptomycin 6-kinase